MSDVSAAGGREVSREQFWLVRAERPEGFGGVDIVGVVRAETSTAAIVEWLSGMHGGSWTFVRVSAELVQPHPIPG